MSLTLHDLISLILAPENLALAWQKVLEKKGSPGLDGVTVERWQRNWEANLERLRQQVKTNTYKPNRLKRFYVAKKNGGRRELCILTIADRVLQRAVLNVLDPIYDRRFLTCSHGYRQNHSVATAVQQVLEWRDRGLIWVLDADIEACFDSLDHGILLNLLRRVISDWHVLNLMQLWLKAGRREKSLAVGVPMGAVLSPLWANITLHQMDARLSCAGWKLVRYADDFIILTKSRADAEKALAETRTVLQSLKLDLSERKTSITSFNQGFDFLGVHFQHDTYSYLWQEKRITIQGRKLRWLYSYHPDFY